MELVPIKVKIGLRANGHADHPDWNLLPSINKGINEKIYMPFGWMYDKQCGHAESRTDTKWGSSVGMQWGCLLVTEKFANEAVETFPTLVTILTEAEFGDFYDTKVTAHIPEIFYNTEELNGLKLEHDLKVIGGEDVTDIKTRIAKAIDVNDTTTGITKRLDKSWDDKKSSIDVTIKNTAMGK